MTWNGEKRRKSDYSPDNVTKLNVILDTLTEIVNRHDKDLNGNSDNGTPGIKTELDRIKQDKKRHELAFMAAWSSLVGLILKTLWDAIFKR